MRMRWLPAARSGWPMPTRPIRARPGCTGIIPSRPRLRRCLPCSRCARPGSEWPPGTGANDRPTRSRWPLHAWEPVLYHGGRQLLTDGQRRVDSLAYGVGPLHPLPGRVIGAKPAAMCRWIFTLLGAAPGDTLDDLFPGSGAVSRAWAAYTGQDPSSPPACHAPRQAPGRRVVPGRERWL